MGRCVHAAHRGLTMMRMRRFFRSVYEDNADRKPDDRRSIVGDVVRYFANRLAQPLDRVLVRKHRDPSMPIVFVVGVPRSGTTLLSACLGRSETLYIGAATVKTHVSNILTKVGLRDRAQAVVFAYESGLITPGHHDIGH